jgi:hypothetical protein
MPKKEHSRDPTSPTYAMNVPARAQTAATQAEGVRVLVAYHDPSHGAGHSDWPYRLRNDQPNPDGRFRARVLWSPDRGPERAWRAPAVIALYHLVVFLLGLWVIWELSA